MLEADTLVQRRYRVISQIGRGGMGTVYLARDENLGVMVAVKQNIFDDPRLIEAFKREARLVAGLRHQALPQIKDYFINDAGQFLVMEYIAGDNFESILEKRKQKIEPVGQPKPFEVSEVLHWAEQLLDALDYLHTLPESVIHRDIKPQNLKLAGRNQIILLDFGLAKGKPQWMTRVTTTGSIHGYTPNYAPMEQIRGIGTEPRSDLYALGATLYHLITGTAPVDAATRADTVIGGEPDPLLAVNEVNSQVPREIAAVLMKSLAQHRNKRPATAREMLEALRAAKYSTVIDRSPRAGSDQPGESGIIADTKDSYPITEINLRNRADEDRKAREEVERLRELEEQEERERRAEALRQEQEQKALEERYDAERRAEASRLEQEKREQEQLAQEAADVLKLERQMQASPKPESLPFEEAPLNRAQKIQAPVNQAYVNQASVNYAAINKARLRKPALIGASGIVLIILAFAIVWKFYLPSPDQAAQETAQSLASPAQTGAKLTPLQTMEFAQIPPGVFEMGSRHGEADERPTQGVIIRNVFEMSKWEVTQELWQSVMGNNPSHFKGAKLPVEQVSWNDVQQFIQKLNEHSDGYIYRLPTEAEWEYACRAGSEDDYAGNLDEMAWYNKNSGGKTHPVGEKNPNAWGLYDMHGNVLEWVNDWYSRYAYLQTPSGIDPQGPAKGSERVFRGGCWDYEARYCRSAYRNRFSPDFRRYLLGFRLVRTPR
jgi:formylglycine-generating enzyme required for sulfatase activity/serine/threonine protein kinase